LKTNVFLTDMAQRHTLAQATETTNDFECWRLMANASGKVNKRTSHHGGPFSDHRPNTKAKLASRGGETGTLAPFSSSSSRYSAL
jgi:hypothetical protein